MEGVGRVMISEASTASVYELPVSHEPGWWWRPRTLVPMGTLGLGGREGGGGRSRVDHKVVEERN